MAKICAESAADKKAQDIILLDLRGISDVADFYVLCTGSSDPHIKAVRDSVEDDLREKHGIRAHRVEGSPTSRWIILDYADVVVHILDREKRMLYALETLWNDAPAYQFDDSQEADELELAGPAEGATPQQVK